MHIREYAFNQYYNCIQKLNGLTKSCLPFVNPQAVAVGAKFVKFGAPSRGERVSQYNRLIQISEMLEQQGKLTVSEAFEFPILKPPEPEPEEPVEGDGSAGGQDS